MRLACLLVPLFPLAARLRGEPDLASEAVVVVEGSGGGARVVAATRPARRAGVGPGQTLSQARARVSRLAARPRDPEGERAAQDALLEAAESISPRVEDAGGGSAYVDLEGLGRLFRGERPEEDLARALAAAAHAVALPARVGIAGSKLAARVAAALPGSPTLVPPGEEASFLAPLPLHRLAPATAVAHTLERWGVRSIGDLARLPAAEVASRLGRAGEDLHAIARGLDPRPLVPREPPASFREALSLDWPLTSLEPFLFVARPALDRLCRRLETRGLACARLEIALHLEPDGIAERTFALPAPCRDPGTLLTTTRLHLEEHPPGAPVAGFAFTAHPDRPRESQLSLFGPAELSPERLATTLVRLFALLGPGRLGSPRPVDGHAPERFTLVDYAPPPAPTSPPPPSSRGRGLLAVRTLRPAVPIEVIADGGPGGEAGRPLEIRPAVGEDAARRPCIAGHIRVASGPWSLEEGWWAERPTRRDYWDVELAGGGLYRIYRDRGDDEWYADGIYD